MINSAPLPRLSLDSKFLQIYNVRRDPSYLLFARRKPAPLVLHRGWIFFIFFPTWKDPSHKPLHIPPPPITAEKRFLSCDTLPRVVPFRLKRDFSFFGRRAARCFVFSGIYFEPTPLMYFFSGELTLTGWFVSVFQKRTSCFFFCFPFGEPFLLERKHKPLPLLPWLPTLLFCSKPKPNL